MPRLTLLLSSRVNEETPAFTLPRPPTNHTKDQSGSIFYSRLHDTLFPRALLTDLDELEARSRTVIKSTLLSLAPPLRLFVNLNNRIIPVHPDDRDMTLKAVVKVRKLEEKKVIATFHREALKALPTLQASTYAGRFIPLLDTELLGMFPFFTLNKSANLQYTARAQLLHVAELYQSQITPLDADSGEALLPSGLPARLFSLEARSIREGHPPVDLGDEVNLRQLRPLQQSWQGILFIATVWGINRARGSVILRCEELMPNYQEVPFFDTSLSYVELIPFLLNFSPWYSTLSGMCSAGISKPGRKESKRFIWMCLKLVRYRLHRRGKGPLVHAGCSQK